MAVINETAHPQPSRAISVKDLRELFTPTEFEKRFISDHYRRATTQALLALQLKLLQRLGTLATVGDIPDIIVAHLCDTYRDPVFAVSTRTPNRNSPTLSMCCLRNSFIIVTSYPDSPPCRSSSAERALRQTSNSIDKLLTGSQTSSRSS